MDDERGQEPDRRGRAPFTGAERAALALSGILVIAAASLPGVWRWLDPPLHARWWFVHGGPAARTGAWTAASGRPPRYDPAPVGMERWVEIDTGPRGRHAWWADVRCVGFRPPEADPWGNAWRFAPPDPGFRPAAPGCRVMPDSHGGADPGRGTSGLAWSVGPDGWWDGGRGDDVLIDPAPLAIALPDHCARLLILGAVSVAGAVVLVRRLPDRSSTGREVAGSGVVVALLSASLIATAEHGYFAIDAVLGSRQAFLVAPRRVAVYGSAVLVIVLGVAWLRLCRRSQSAGPTGADPPVAR